jgi:cell division protein FtsQ
LRQTKPNSQDADSVPTAPRWPRAGTPDDQTTRHAGVPAFLRSNIQRDLPEDFNVNRRRAQFGVDPFAIDDESAPMPRRQRAIHLRVRGRLPRSVFGRVVALLCVLTCFGATAFGLWRARAAILHDPRFTIASSQAIEISGNNHLTRGQLLSVFGEDVDRNLLTVPLDVRRAELEALPWVEHATVMRLLPNQLRIAITERTPVAYVRQGTEIGLVDASGVLLENTTGDPANTYSFPVVTGIAANDPASTRAARMKLFLRFTGELDAGAKSGQDKISRHLSEVDLTDPEDVKALIPDNGTDVLVHFGDNDFRNRYQHYIQNLPDWKVRYPKLASADMRYDREVVLEMAPGTSVPVSPAQVQPNPRPAPRAAKPTVRPAPKSLAKLVPKPVAKPPAGKTKPLAKKPVPAPRTPVKPAPVASKKPAPAVKGHPKAVTR